MKIHGSDIYFVIEKTPDYTSVVGLATTEREAIEMQHAELPVTTEVVRVQLSDLLQMFPGKLSLFQRYSPLG